MLQECVNATKQMDSTGLMDLAKHVQPDPFITNQHQNVK